MAVDVPLTKEGGFYFADVQVNGGSFRFTLETGAGFFAISRRAVEALGLEVVRQNLIGDTVSEVVRVQELRMGGAVFTGLTARVRDEWDGTFDGLISIPLLRDTLATLDLSRRPEPRVRTRRSAWTA